MHQSIARPFSLVLLAVWICMIDLSFAQAQNELARHVTTELNAALDEAVERNSITPAIRRLDDLFAVVVAYGSEKSDAALFREVALTRRMAHDLRNANARNAIPRLTFLRERPELRNALAMLSESERGQLENVYAMFDRFRQSRPAGALEQYASLVAAICFVHDEPFHRRVNENHPAAPDPLSIFDYYVANEKKMAFGIRELPPEVLIYVVDTTSSIDEMHWALSRYERDRNIGKRFFDIQYDYAHAVQGKPKKCTQAGYNLPNILKYGGVCADQTYFAMSVGKALGIPTTYTRGRDAQVSHAWVGYLEAKGRNANWNDEAGRYESYQGVRGTVMHPQTGRPIPDSYVAILAEFMGSSQIDRESAAAFLDAARMLGEITKRSASTDWPPDSSWADKSEVRDRPIGTDTQLKFLEASLRRCAAYVPAWMELTRLAESNELNNEQLKDWSDLLFKYCGTKYPDFSLDVVGPMIASVKGADQQNEIWNRAFKTFNRRADLAAEIRFKQGELWEEQNNQKMAAKCYEDVIKRYLNSGPFVLHALARLEAMLRAGNRDNRVAGLYGEVWKRIPLPKKYAPGYFRQSNWYLVGSLYAQRLKEAGRAKEAAKIAAQLARAGGG